MYLKNVILITVNIVRAQHLPKTNTKIDYETDMFDERGGIFHSSKHQVTVVVPGGAICEGDLVELKFGATLNAPVKFSSNKILISAIYWLCMDTVLQKPLQLFLPHIASIESEEHASHLQFVKLQHLDFEETMSIVEGGKFPVGESYGSIEINHFCYYCIVVDKLDRSKIPSNKYYVAAMVQQQSQLGNWEAHICCIPRLPTCLQVVK